MHTTIRRFNVTIALLVGLVGVAAGLLNCAHGAAVSATGYTNDFSGQPGVSDWSTYSIGGGAGDVTSAAALDAEVLALPASVITIPLAPNGTLPPDFNASATWASAGFYLQTRPTGNRATLLMCTLVNNLGVEASGASISYDYIRTATVTEEVDGHRAFYSLSGAAGSWTPIPQFFTTSNGRLSASFNITWPNGSPLYIVWADDNGSGSPDTSYQIDNFFVSATPAFQLPVTITNQPQSQIVSELKPASFTVGVNGYPTPTVQWYTNNVAIPGATNTTYSIASAPLSYNGLNFRAIAQNVANSTPYSATSSVATLTVNADTAPPTLVSVLGAGISAIAIAFSEPVRIDTATNLANYVVTNNAGVLTITGAVLSADQTNVTLFTLSQTLGSHYTVIINGIRDVSAAANQIAPNTIGGFDTADFAANNIGNPAISGGVTNVSGGYNISGAGTDFGGTSDQFTLAAQIKAGDFDVRVRVANLGATDPLAKAAIMARETLDANSRFAAAIASPAAAGCFFESRAAIGGNAANTGSFPINYPDMWLRLRRVGNVFTGFAGPDGTTWVQLGSVTLAVGNVNLGFAVTSHDAAQSTTAEFREYTSVDTNAVVVTSMSFATESLSAVARTGPMVISEIMYRPANTNLEFVELYNSNPFFEDISGYRLSGDIAFTFPPNTIVPGGTFVVVARNPSALQTAYGLTGVFGPYSNSLPNKGTIRLRSDVNAILLEVNYSDDKPWPVGADGTGHSLALTRASYGQNFPRSWDESDRLGGSPGRHELLRMKTGQRAVVINEILAHTDLPQLDYIELYNYSMQPVDISGCYLSDAAATNKFRIPSNTTLPPHGYISFNETTLGFALGHNGETIYFRSTDGTRMLDAVQYEAQENGVAFGRYPDGSPELYRLRALTPGTTNAPVLVDDIVINEIMYAPISEEDRDEFVELYNKGTNAVNVGGWRFTHGIDFKFPENTIIQPDSYLVVAKDALHLRPRYTNLTTANTLGNFDGQLSRDGERVALAKPDYDVITNGNLLFTNVDYIIVEEVTYGTGGRWGQWANQGGSSLELIDPRSNHRLAYNWGDSDETAKSQWTYFEQTGLLDTGSTQGGSPINRLEVVMLGEGECLIDDVELYSPATNSVNLAPNPSFESGLSPWIPQGNHIYSSLENSGRLGNRSLHVRSDGNGDTGANRIRLAISANLTAGQTASLKGYVRWLRGWPEVTLRIKGGFLEAYGRMDVPANLGTPGQRNSRALTNNAPAIYGVTHVPVLPQVGESVVVKAGVHDPDGVANATLFYRVDSASPPAFSTLAMNDSGINGDAIAGDGIYSGMIPPQASGTMISFYVEATDTKSATSQFPVNAVVIAPDGQRRECLVRWGDPMPVSTFATYRLWMSQANANSYINRPALSNQDIDSTMVVNNNRVIYNMYSHYSNSPYHQGQNGSPLTGGQHFDVHLPLDDKYLGTENFNKIHAPGNASFEDNNWLREQTAYWVARKMGLPYLYRRFVAMYVNGARKAGSNAGPDALMEDTQRPGGELIDEFFPDETEGRLFKLQPWFEFDDVTVTGGTGAAFENKLWCTLTRNLSTNAHKITRYRQNYLSRSTDVTANDYTNVIALIETANVPTTSPTYWPNLSKLIDVEQWARIFAVEHAVGNWDSFGGVNAQNMYGYKPKDGKWKLMIWDLNIVLNHASAGSAGPGTTSNPPGGNLFDVQSGQDPIMQAMEAYPPFRRAWWRSYKELTVGPNAPMLAANCNPLIDAKNEAFRDNGLTPGAFTAGNPNSVKQFLAVAQASIANTVAANDFGGGFVVSTPSVTASSSNVVTVTGSATFDVTDIQFNGQSWPITWTSITAWSVSIPVTNSASLQVVALDRTGRVIGNTNTVTVNYSAPAPPDPRGLIVFNEVMYNPSSTSPDAEYIEFYNMHTSFTFDVSGWRVNGVDYTFPQGSYFPPRTYLVLAKDRVAFNVAYGANIPVFDAYLGKLQGDGETLTLIKPAASTNGVDVVIDRMHYDSSTPWPTNAAGTGSSAQLIDPNQENARAGNWFASYVPAVYCCGSYTPPRTNDGWQFISSFGSIGSGSGAGQFRLIMFLGQELGTALVDDISLVDGTNAAVGYNYIRNGDFESPLYEETSLTNSWMVGTNYTNSLIVSDLKHSGSGSLKMIPTSFGNSVTITATTTNNRVIYQALSPAPAINSINTLSFWYWATNSSTNLTVRIVNSAVGTVNVTTNINISFTPSSTVLAKLVTAATNSLSPGAANQNVTSLPAFPPLWINEVQAENITGITDNRGEREPWIEIYNTSTNAVSLDGLFLSSNYTNLTNWAFPAGSSIGPTQFLVVFCDAQPVQTSNTEYHTSFRLPATSGSIALSRLYTNAPQVLDYVNYAGLHSDKSYGSYPDGQPFDRLEFFYVTPRGTNDGRSAPLVVFINEWLASNLAGERDPADAAFDDWFELYNPSTNTVDIAGAYLTDNLTNKFQFLITTNMAHTIPPKGHLLVWADNEANQNTIGGTIRPDLHVSFQLAKAGEAIGLFAADGTQIDAVTFAGQTDDVSVGRIPDGGANIVVMPGTASPRAPNYLAGASNAPPVLNPIGDKTVYLGSTLTFTATATDSDLPAQILTYDLIGAPAGATIGAGTGNFSWAPTVAGNYSVTVRVRDSGLPQGNDQETITVHVLALAFGGPVRRGTNLELTWGTQAGKKYAVDQTTNLNTPILWSPQVTNTALGTSLSYTNTTTNGLQKFFRVRQVD